MNSSSTEPIRDVEAAEALSHSGWVSYQYLYNILEAEVKTNAPEAALKPSRVHIPGVNSFPVGRNDI